MDGQLIRCSDCKKPIVKITKYSDWLSLYNFFEFLFFEGYIEEATYNSMLDKLMTFKVCCDEEEG